MSKGYNPTISNPAFLAQLAKDAEEFKIDILNTKDNFFNTDSDKYHTTYNALLNNSVFRAATHLLRFNAAGFDKFKRVLDMVLIDYARGADVYTHLIIPGPSPDRVIVFPNIPLNSPDYDRLGCVSWCTRTEVLKDFYILLADHLADETKAQGWQPFKRGLKRLWKSETIATERALTRYTSLAKLCNTAQIRDIAAAYVEAITPAKITFTEKPEDFVKMYGDGPSSCMSNVKGADGAWKVLFNRGLSPMSFYGYSPYAKGAYIMNAKGSVISRTICLQNENGKWVHGRIYSATEKNRAQFLTALSNEGIRPLKEGIDLNHKDALKGVNWDRTYSFEIPGVPTAGIEVGGAGPDVYAMPLPYLDNHTRNLNVTFNKQTKVFTVNVNCDMAVNVEGQTTNGYVLSSRLETAACDACGIKVLSTKAIFSQDGNCVFCSKACVAAGKYVYAYRDDGTFAVISEETAVQDAYQLGVYYSNINAASARMAFPYISSVFDLPEEGTELYTANRGCVTRINAEFYRLDKEEANVLFGRKILKHERHGDYGDIFAMDIAAAQKATGTSDIDIRQSRVVLIEENFTPIDKKEVETLLLNLI